MKKAPKIVFSNLNFLDNPATRLWTPAQVGEFAQAAGYDGVEYAPVWDKVPGRGIRSLKRAVTAHQIEVVGTHAGFRTSRASRDTNIDPHTYRPSLRDRCINGPLGRIIMPSVVGSAKVIDRIQAELDIRVPVVLYPQRTDAADKKQLDELSDGRPKIFQYTSHVARLVGARSIEEFDETMTGRGWDGYVLDTFHARRQYGTEGGLMTGDILASVAYFAGKTKAVHLSVNRTDIPNEPHIPTEADMFSAFDGTYAGTEMGDMLDVLKDKGDIEYVSVETLSLGIAATSGGSDPESMLRPYEDIATGLREYWAT